MYTQNTKLQGSINRNKSYEAETIEETIVRALTNGEKIEGGNTLIYTEKNEGVVPAYNPRTDKWDLAIDAQEKIQEIKATKSKLSIVKDTEQDANGTENN